MEGQIGSIWVHMRKEDIRSRKLLRGGDKWARGLMTRLLQMTHQQWLYRNATVHLKIRDGCTVVQHKNLLKEMVQCINTDPEDLLREHKHLLFTNFRKLANGPAQEKRQWVAEYHAAKSLARHVGKGTKVTLKTRYTQANMHKVAQKGRQVKLTHKGARGGAGGDGYNQS